MIYPWLPDLCVLRESVQERDFKPASHGSLFVYVFFTLAIERVGLFQALAITCWATIATWMNKRNCILVSCGGYKLSNNHAGCGTRTVSNNVETIPEHWPQKAQVTNRTGLANMFGSAWIFAPPKAKRWVLRKALVTFKILHNFQGGHDWKKC